MTGPVFALIIVVVAVTLSLIMSVSWVVWRRTRNSGWIDATWTFGLGATGLAGALAPSLLSGSVLRRQALVATFIAVGLCGLGSTSFGARHASLTTRATPGWCAGGAPVRRCKCSACAEAGIGQRSARAIGLACCMESGPGLRLQDIFAVFVLIVAIGARRSPTPNCDASALFRPTAPASAISDLGMVAPSELFLRVVRLARLSAVRNRFWRHLSWGWIAVA